MAREQARVIPDSYYRLAQKETFKDIHSISDILTNGLKGLAGIYLEIGNKRIYVSTKMQTEWQQLVTHIPPLLLQCAFLQDKVIIDRRNNASMLNVVKDYLLPNMRYTAIPNARIPQLDHYIEQQQGLHDLHMHLNGALETDQVWQDYLFTPDGIYQDLKKAFANQKVKEQLEQESHLFEPETYVSLLKAAQRLRYFFFDYLFHSQIRAEDEIQPHRKSKHTLLQSMLNPYLTYSGSYRHPFVSLISSDIKYPYLMSVEALMYLLLLQEIGQKSNETLAGLFHFYLLILGLTNRLLVQQTHQNGFDQFQKHTLNGLREQSERTYLRRYFQMHGNDAKHLRFLEGRFSPKSTMKESIVFIDSIWNGWQRMCDGLDQLRKESDIAVFHQPELRLIAHFIKKPDKGNDPFIRHKELRYDLWQRGKVLSLLLSRHVRYRRRVVGVDAAANEFDASPEVFAPVFRLMRRSGVRHFTYHAGEDFYHIPGGLRAIYEAMVFCDLQKGDRIGHATAAGLPAAQWTQLIGPQILMQQGAYLDDLIFTYHLIITYQITSLHALIPFITNKIQDLAYIIYDNYYPPAILEKSWLMRQCCPVHVIHQDKESVSTKTVFNEEEWEFPHLAGFIDNRKKQDVSDKALEVFARYHDQQYRVAYNKIISVDPFHIMKPEDITVLQLALLGQMNRREIVIETLPTSNVRIGIHQDFSTYHLYNWIKWREEGKSIPPIVVGSDDTGIFATNIYCALLYHHCLPHAQVMGIIKKLDEDSRIYRFE